MPVEDHAVHEKTVKKTGANEACQWKERKDGYFVLTRMYAPDGIYQLVDEWVDDTSSPACRYMDYEHDSGCTGCPQPKDMEYIEKMRGLK